MLWNWNVKIIGVFAVLPKSSFAVAYVVTSCGLAFPILSLQLIFHICISFCNSFVTVSGLQ